MEDVLECTRDLTIDQVQTVMKTVYKFDQNILDKFKGTYSYFFYCSF